MRPSSKAATPSASYGCGALQLQFRKRNAQSIKSVLRGRRARARFVAASFCGLRTASRRVDGVERPAGAVVAAPRRSLLESTQAPATQEIPERAQGARGFKAGR